MPAHKSSQLREWLLSLFPVFSSERPGKARSRPGMKSHAWPVLLIASVLLVATGCGGGGGGGGAPSGGDNGNNDDGYDDDDDDMDDPGDDPGAIQPTLASIQDNVFTPICTECHTGASAPQGLRLEEGMSYGMLVGVASTEVPELQRVNPGNPDDSYLVHKIEGTATVGARMPLGGPYLSADTISAIRQWITDGALESAVPAEQSKTMLTGAWPVPDSELAAAPTDIVLIADAELDTSLLHAGSVRIVKLDDIDATTGQPRTMPNAEMQITSLAPTVIRLRLPAEDWSPGRYEVRVDGSGPLAVADIHGRVIDGNVDGQPGGDFVMHFDIEPDQ